MLNNYIILVDRHKKERSLYRLSLKGRYRVGATSEKEALDLMRKYLGKFGSPEIYYKCPKNDVIAKKGEIIVEIKSYDKEMFQSGDGRNIQNVRYAKIENGHFVYD